MRRSFGKIDEGKNKSTIHLNVLYPAIIMPTGDRSIAEGSQLSLSCPVINGNPPNFTTWSRRTDQRLWNQTLYIQNVSRADDTVYSCSVITEMFPTIGSPLRVERKNSFHLNVFFQSEIIKFSVSTTSSVKIVVINRTENTSFICIAVANPPSDLSIKDPAGDIISDVSKQNTAHHTIHNASYINAGEYICTGRNNYTSGQPTSSKLILIVRTQPRPSSDDTSVQKVSTALFIDAKLQFVAWNYLDKPNETVFSWFKENVSIPDNDSKYMVHSNELQTNITIRNTTQQDLGLYKLNVQNSVGTYTHFYELKATDTPETPRDFRVINDSLTDRSVTLTWSPGFNGGFQQIFVIIYRKKNANIWLDKSTKDNGDKSMNYTLYHLTSSTEYEIEMFSKNMEGYSNLTERLRFKTKEAFTSEATLQSGDRSGIIAGSISAVVIVVVIVGGVLFLQRRCH
ncbi:neural cell adhesion molecule 1-like isoform X2 [Ruditapes philippinarum]|uniref:neural cell adhesion molecule 1-like isoform X2 n=1 Tax=Ruditapes philippinarum TaxID=129788 RepID=UPI00295B20AB|nr:neural cell adhesion molecule 1-like isoform X2 [Ruditapes philippinarum]